MCNSLGCKFCWHLVRYIEWQWYKSKQFHFLCNFYTAEATNENNMWTFIHDLIIIFCFCFDKGSLAHFHGHARSLKTRHLWWPHEIYLFEKCKYRADNFFVKFVQKISSFYKYFFRLLYKTSKTSMIMSRNKLFRRQHGNKIFIACMYFY